ncbi:hypothetical protein SCUCBS95973_006034 [Sporothrix curviconia]|uniref:Uncharacterized protein n=1 Tax=Sporothrix curviconia TaxID=1260050 RepID=A0ABP0C1Q5_9PEZI
MNRLPLVNAMMQYQAAVAAFESLADCQDSDFSTVMVLLDAAVKRGGSPGLLPHAVVRLLDQHIHDVPSLAVPDSDSYSDSCSDAGNVLYDFVSGPIFCFYRHLQMLSNEVASVSHYHRSRVTPDDQAEAADIVAGIQARLSSLWEARPGPLRFPPPTIRAHFGSAIAEPLVALAGICIVAYLAEVVAIGRTLADPPFAGPEAVEAMQLIRNLVDSNEWNAAGRDGLNAGYLRALFLYAIETGEETQTRWAVDRLRQINDPLSRSEFAASLAESLGETQRKNRRRVTVKYFCYKMFGVPTPFM